MPSKANVGATHKEQRQCTLYKRLRKVWPVETAHAPICRMSCFIFSIFSSILFHFQNLLFQGLLLCSVYFTFWVFSSILSVSLSVFSSILSVSLSESSPLFCLSRFQSLLLYQQLWWLPWLFSVDISKSLTISSNSKHNYDQCKWELLSLG